MQTAAKPKLAGIDASALSALEAYDWPGNIRQLQNEIERAVALTASGEKISLDVLQLSTIRARPSGAGAVGSSADLVPDQDFLPMRAARALFEADYVSRSLKRNDGNVTRTAEELELSRFMVQKKMKDYGLRRDN